MLVIETVLDFTATVPTLTGPAYGKDKDPAKMKIVFSISNGGINIDTTVTTQREGVKKSHQGPLARKK